MKGREDGLLAFAVGGNALQYIYNRKSRTLIWSPTGKARGTSIEIPSYACLREAPPPEALRRAGAPAKARQGFGGLSTGGEIHRSIKF